MIRLASLISVVISLCTPAFSLDVSAQEKSVALVVRASGLSSIIRGTKATELENRAELFTGDQIVTSDGAWVTINFYDLTRVVLRPRSSFIIHEFPQTMGSSKVQLELENGAVRIISGTNSNGGADGFSLITPEGVINASRSEWVVKVCQADECEVSRESFSRCLNYVKPPLLNRQLVAVYRGTVNLDYCSFEFPVRVGTTAVSGLRSESCEIIEQIPCVILSDGKLGEDKLRAFSPSLSKLPESEEDEHRPSSIPPRQQARPPMPRPRGNRPNARPRQTK